MGTPRPTPAAQATAVLERLREEHPDATIALEFDSRLDLLVAVVLSAQCTDERVNAVTDDLFERYQSPEDYASVDQDQLADDIGSITYPNQKAGYIQEACRTIVEEHDGEVPDTMDALTDLHGIGRKTANVILQFGHGTVEGVVVDTHVQRLTRRLGLTEATDPEAIERDLMEVLDEADWQAWADLLIAHGRRVCTARNPACEDCTLAEICPSERGDGAVDLASGEPWD
jgi:endonuclease-3